MSSAPPTRTAQLRESCCSPLRPPQKPPRCWLKRERKPTLEACHSPKVTRFLAPPPGLVAGLPSPPSNLTSLPSRTLIVISSSCTLKPLQLSSIHFPSRPITLCSHCLRASPLRPAVPVLHFASFSDKPLPRSTRPHHLISLAPATVTKTTHPSEPSAQPSTYTHSATTILLPPHTTLRHLYNNPDTHNGLPHYNHTSLPPRPQL